MQARGNPNVDLISGQRLAGNCCSAAGIVLADPPHRQTGTPPAAMINSRGVYSQRMPTTGRPDFFAAVA